MQNTLDESSSEENYEELRRQYLEKADRCLKLADGLSEKYNRYSLVRLFAFLGSVVAIALLWVQWWPLGIFSMIIFLLSFYRFVIWHQEIKNREVHNRYLHEINLNEEKALDYDFSSFKKGEDYVHPLHPYSIDLDIFDTHSIYQACDRTVSIMGSKQLAHFFLEPATPEKIKLRQETIKELARKRDWRQDFQALGMGTTDDELHYNLLRDWLNDPLFFKGKSWLKWMLWFVPVWMIAGTILSFTLLPLEAVIFFLLLPAIILRNTLKKINDLHNRTSKAVDILEKYAGLIHHIEKVEFNSQILQDLYQHFSKDGAVASKSIRRLAYIINQLNVRFNPFAILLNLYALWDLQWMNQLDRWKVNNGDLLLTWFDGLKYIDAYNSLSTLSANNPDWIFPQITSADLLIAKDLGHPLLHAKKRVVNDIQLPTDGHIKLITGSNMGGKTTFLRTLGLNVVLAMTGLPVCAREFSLPPLWVYSSMRTQDSLHESTSSFFAELKRLKTIIEAVESHKDTQPPQPKILFLLDEILKGTNSADRHKGSKALLLQLIQSKGSGLVATHDLELGYLEKEYPKSIENWCFEVDIEEGKLSFDYKLKKGVSKSFNATILMKEMGIKM